MPRRLFVAWQDSQTRAWHTVARLEKVAGEYELAFTEGAREFKSIIHSLFMMDPQYRYRFKDLIPAFKNKIPPKSRSDYNHLSRWFGVSGHEDDYELLAKFGIMQGNDPLIVYPEPLVANGKYECSFFIHAVRYMHPDALNWLKAAEHGAIVLPMLDVLNEVDPHAVALRSSPGSILIGYVPAYLAKDIGTLLKDPLCAKNSHFTISAVNTEAPIQMIAMCRLVAQVPFDFKALDTQNHQIYGTIM